MGADMLYRVRHSTAHVMAEAVLQLFPEAKLAIGPPIDDGFYYDFLLTRSLTPDDLKEVTRRMKKVIAGNHAFTKRVVSRDEAQDMFSGQPFKLQLIDDISDDDELSVYTQNRFTDLCRGPHVTSTAEIAVNAIKLLSVAGAYWRGNERQPMLQRIYGTAFETREELEAHLKRLAEAEKRDHRKLGRELDLFSTHDEAGSGLIFWHPKAARIRVAMEAYWREQHEAGGYELLNTPHIGKAGLWQTSGHLEYFADNMYAPMDIDGAEYYLKPMNCPFHILIYKNALRSYRELPLRWAELGTVYRYERSGVLHGLLRVRGFTQDDAHIFCTPQQVESEISEVLRFSLAIWRAYGFEDIIAYLATRPEKAVGEPEEWERAQTALVTAIEAHDLPYETEAGGGAFYGPKIDLYVRDAIGRTWQMTTIQFDFNLPERFGMTYVDRDGQEKRPVMVHRALHGSIERFFGVLTEHYAGAFPTWLAPVQVLVLPVVDAVTVYAGEVRDALRRDGIRAEIDASDNRLGARIRTAQQQKIPFMLVIGEDEAASGLVSLRARDGSREDRIALEDARSTVRNAIDQKL